jgi:hypothetical protein
MVVRSIQKPVTSTYPVCAPKLTELTQYGQGVCNCQRKSCVMFWILACK